MKEQDHQGGHASVTCKPRFNYTNALVNDLMRIESARQLVEVLPLPPDALASVSGGSTSN